MELKIQEIMECYDRTAKKFPSYEGKNFRSFFEFELLQLWAQKLEEMANGFEKEKKGVK